MDIESQEPIPDPWYKGPLIIILAVFLILILVLWIPSHYFIVNPRPKQIPSIKEVLPSDFDFKSNGTVALKSQQDFLHFINPEDPIIRPAAAQIVSQCDGNNVCSVEALYLFVRNNINYVSDPVDFEYVEDPKEVLKVKGADCESGTLLLADMVESVGIDAQLVFIPNHAFLRVYLPDASPLIKHDDWVYLDWTCSSCDFGDVPQTDLSSHKEYIDVS